jgi:hypothetical protein
MTHRYRFSMVLGDIPASELPFSGVLTEQTFRIHLSDRTEEPRSQEEWTRHMTDREIRERLQSGVAMYARAERGI